MLVRNVHVFFFCASSQMTALWTKMSKLEGWIEIIKGGQKASVDGEQKLGGRDRVVNWGPAIHCRCVEGRRNWLRRWLTGVERVSDGKPCVRREVGGAIIVQQVQEHCRKGAMIRGEQAKNGKQPLGGLCMLGRVMSLR